MVINCKPLNGVLNWNRYYVPIKSDLIKRITRCKVFSKFDLKRGFWQIGITEEDQYKTTFIVPHGHFKWTMMPFGLNNAPSQFQNVMETMFKAYMDWLMIYIDDILIFSKPFEDH